MASSTSSGTSHSRHPLLTQNGAFMQLTRRRLLQLSAGNLLSCKQRVFRRRPHLDARHRHQTVPASIPDARRASLLLDRTHEGPAEYHGTLATAAPAVE